MRIRRRGRKCAFCGKPLPKAVHVTTPRWRNYHAACLRPAEIARRLGGA